MQQMDLKKYFSKRAVVVSGLAIGAVFLYKAWIQCKKNRVNEIIRQSFDSARLRTLAALQERTECLKQDENDLTNLAFDELQESLLEGRVSPTEVLRAYQRKSLEVHNKTNCITDVIREAEDIARELEAGPEKKGVLETKGVLYGIPVSIKDSIPMKNYPFHCGCVSLADTDCDVDAVFMKMLLRAGAVPFVRTAVPQLCMAHETSNPIYGNVCNPWDVGRGPGGSSGGEAALIGGGGSVLGIGTDIGGSIRGPALFCGICGLKPGVNRISDITAYEPWGQTIVLPTMGPMARDVNGLVALMKCMLVPDMYEEDPHIPYLPFRDHIYENEKPMKIGYFVFDGYYHVVPAIARAIKEATDALEKAGHTVVPWQPPKPKASILYYMFKSIHGDAGADFLEDLEGDIVDESVAHLHSLLKKNYVFRWLQSVYLRLTGNEQHAEFMNSFAGVHSVTDWWALTADIEIYRREFVSRWKESGLDGIVCPSGATLAPKLGSSDKLLRMSTYLYLFNVLDLPAGVVPVSRATADDIRGLSCYETGDDLTEWVKKDQQGTEGLPVGVQVAALRWQEETCLRIMKDIESNVGYNKSDDGGD